MPGAAQPSYVSGSVTAVPKTIIGRKIAGTEISYCSPVAGNGRRFDPSEGAGLEVKLDGPLPATIPVGARTALFCAGTCYHRRRGVAEMTIVVDGAAHRPSAQRMPRLDRFREHPELRSYRSGFWATVP